MPFQPRAAQQPPGVELHALEKPIDRMIKGDTPLIGFDRREAADGRSCPS